MWTLQIGLNSLDLKNTDTPSQSTFVTHLNNFNFENADTLIQSTPWQKSGMSDSTFQNICTVQTWQMWTLKIGVHFSLVQTVHTNSYILIYGKPRKTGWCLHICYVSETQIQV